LRKFESAVDVHDEVTKWFAREARDLPWRKSTPWGVMVSEFMLQQTPVVRVLPKWNEWMERWPTPLDLAESQKSDVIRAWGSIGYPRRALRLWESAKVIASDHENEVPRDIDSLRALPGVGQYTATAIASFAFDQSHNVMDINIRRVFARAIDGIEHPPKSVRSYERDRPVFGPTWSKAVMELGALICTAKDPKCGICPIARSCLWLKDGSPKSTEVRQGQRWHGTKRQCRGQILKALREKEPRSRDELIWDDEEMLQTALEELEREGFITKRGSRYRLA
jgi:A/G-specific adenine glycosylase